MHDVFREQRTKLDELDDPLSVYDAHVHQLHSLVSGGSSVTTELVPLLDEATRTFVQDPRYRNDSRYLRLWLSYAKYCRDAEEIFVFLGQQGIAQELATFYEEYASLIERRAASQPVQTTELYIRLH